MPPQADRFTTRVFRTWIVPAVMLVVLAVSAAPTTAAAAGPGYHPVVTSDDCTACHLSAVPTAPPTGAAAPGAMALQAPGLPPEASLTHWWFGCLDCHDLHGGTANLHLIAEQIDTDALPPDYAVKTGVRPVVLLNEEGPKSYADGDAVYDGICEVCHTNTLHHRGDPSGDHSHFAGARCTNCHDHAKYFQPTGFANHPQAVTDCSNCHRGPKGDPDLPGIHRYQCRRCHPSGFDATILGPLGTWQGECSECHNPSVSATGNLPTPTKGHRCIVCHGRPMPTGNRQEIHQEHVRKADCVVCHGFVPDVGTTIGSGNRAICELCHEAGTSYAGVSSPDFHQRHVRKGLSCLECHGGTRPAVDVLPGPPVGSATDVCRVCHMDRSPSEFSSNPTGLHEEHVGQSMDCGACHASANLQEDRNPMPPIDDPVRAMVPRAGFTECGFCHSGSMAGSSSAVHVRHVARQRQWCYNCHESFDTRPAGLTPPVTRPAEACRLCHGSTRYRSTFPFSVHEEHADEGVKCYACHQLKPPLFDWPAAWRALGSSSSSGGSSGGRTWSGSGGTWSRTRD